MAKPPKCISTVVYRHYVYRCGLRVKHDGDHECEIETLIKLVWHKFHRMGVSK